MLEAVSGDIPVPDWPYTFAGRRKPKDSHKGDVFNKFAHLFRCGNCALPGPLPCGRDRNHLEREFYKHVFEVCGWASSDNQMALAAAAWFRLRLTA
jgi:hypothetical protein